jgi:hypothetical protein
MFSIRITRSFTFEILNGGLFIKLGRREMFYSRELGLSID